MFSVYSRETVIFGLTYMPCVLRNKHIVIAYVLTLLLRRFALVQRGCLERKRVSYGSCVAYLFHFLPIMSLLLAAELRAHACEAFTAQPLFRK